MKFRFAFLMSLAASPPLAGHAAELPEPVVPAGFGINIHFTNPQPGEMEKMAAVGFGVVRMDVYWQNVEKTPGVYDFSAYDGLTAKLRENGMRPLYILCYGNPLYDKGTSPSTDTSRAAYVAFAKAAATHYKGQNVMWEIWNEPNSNTFWRPSANPDDYVAMAIPAARAIREADPTATILAPGSSRFFPWSYFDAIFKKGLLKEIDAVSVHPYRLPKTSPETAAEDYAKLRRLVGTYTPAGQALKPIACSEWGYSTYDKGVTETQQASYLTRQWLANLAEGVNLTVFYDWRDDGNNPADMESRFGIVRRDFSPKPSFDAAAALIGKLRGYRLVHRMPTEKPTDYKLLFRKGDSLALVKWNSADGAAEAEQTPSVEVVNPADKAYAALARTAFVDYETNGLVAIPGQPAEIKVTVENTEKSVAKVELALAGQKQSLQVKPGAKAVAKFLLAESAVQAGTEAELPVSTTWNGEAVADLPPVKLQVAYPLLVQATPVWNGLQVRVSNPSATGFDGEIRWAQGGGNQAQPVKFGPGEMRDVPLSLDPAQETTIKLVSKTGVTMARVGPFRFLPVAGFPTEPGTAGPMEVVRHVRNTPQQLMPAVTDAVGQTEGPMTAALPIPYESVPNSLYMTVRPKKATAIPEGANSAVIWVYSDGAAMPLCARFKDSVGQVFQPTISDMKFKGWKAITIPFSGEMWHYGGPNDGVVRGPLTWDSLLLLDNSRAAGAQGQIRAALPCYSIGQSSIPGF